MAPGRRRASPTQRHQWPCAHNTHKSTRMRSMLPIRPRRAPPCRCRAAAPASTPRMQRGGVFQSPYTHRKHTDDHADEYGQVGNPMCHTPHIRGIWVVMRVKSLVEGGHASLPRPLAYPQSSALTGKRWRKGSTWRSTTAMSRRPTRPRPRPLPHPAFVVRTLRCRTGHQERIGKPCITPIIGP